MVFLNISLMHSECDPSSLYLKYLRKTSNVVSFFLVDMKTLTRYENGPGLAVARHI